MAIPQNKIYTPNTAALLGCPCLQTPFYETKTYLEEDRRPLINQYALTQLAHFSRRFLCRFITKF